MGARLCKVANHYALLSGRTADGTGLLRYLLSETRTGLHKDTQRQM